MFLTISNEIANDKNIKGKTITGLSERKQSIMRQALEASTELYCRLIRWALNHWDEIGFTFLLTKDGVPILDKEGKQKIGVTSAHYLANWLSGRVDASDIKINSRMANGDRNQAAETLKSHYELRQKAEKNPDSLTGEVRMPNVMTKEEIDKNLETALEKLSQYHLSELSKMELTELEKSLSERPRLMPAFFSGPADFPLYRQKKKIQHKASGRIFVSLPLLARGDKKADRFVAHGKNNLEPLRPDTPPLPQSKQWILLPLRLQPQFEKLIADPLVQPRTAELFLDRNSRWRFNIVLDVSETPPTKPQTFMAIKIGYYQILWVVFSPDGSRRESGKIDLSYLRMRKIITDAARRRSQAFSKSQGKKMPNYRGILKLEREKAVNELIRIALFHKAAIGTEEISGVEKSTWSRRINLFRSHWDFGATIKLLTYKSILNGLPFVGRGKKRQLHLTPSYIAAFAHAPCGSMGKSVTKIKDGRIYCSACGTNEPVEDNTLAVIGKRLIEYYLKKK